jgi:hypothetical protein
MTRNILKRGERGYCKKGWRDMRERDSLIRRRHVWQKTRNRRRMTPGQSIARLAYDFRLSERRIEQIVYR